MANGLAPDQGRVIIHIDVDAFYAQVEEVRNPSLRDRPLGVTQKYLIVTCNYTARKHGVQKMMAITRALELCPDLVLISGEDLTPYRHAAKSILSVLKRFGVAERLGLDETLLDVSQAAKERMLQGSPLKFHGHVHMSSVTVCSDNAHRPMDLRAQQTSACPSTASKDATPYCSTDDVYLMNAQDRLLAAGTMIAAEARKALKNEAGFRCSAGIASNRLLAKLASGLHKPDDQTIILPSQASAFVGPLAVRAIPGVGHKLEAQLTEMGMRVVEDLRKMNETDLIRCFGDRTGAFLHKACWGCDPTPVQERGPPKSITVEESFKSCTTLAAARSVITVLAPDLLLRLEEDHDENSRWPRTLTLKWRIQGQGWKRSSSSSAMPNGCQPGQTHSRQSELLATAAMRILEQHLQEPFHLKLINLGATSFVARRPGQLSGPISRFFSPCGQVDGGESGLASGGSCRSLCGAGGFTGAASSGRSAECGTPVAPVASRCVAAANQHSRRDYGGVPRAGILSKRLEREVREHDRLPEEAAVTDIHNGDTGAADAKKAKLGAVKVDTGAGTHNHGEPALDSGVEGWPLGSPRDDAHCQQASAGWAELVLKQAGSLRCQHDLITNLEDDGASMQAPTSTHDCSLRTWASSPAVDGTNEVATANDQDARNRVGSRNDSGSTSRLGAPASTSDNCPPAWGIDCSSGLAHGLDPSRSHNGVLQPVSISCGPASRQQSLLDSLNSRATSFSKETERPQHPRPGSSGFAHHEVLTLKRMAANGELSQGCGGRGGRCQEARTDYEMAVKLQREELGIGRHMDSKISNSNGSKQSSRGLTKSGKGPMDSFLIRR